jgi:hypothetical protein
MKEKCGEGVWKNSEKKKSLKMKENAVVCTDPHGRTGSHDRSGTYLELGGMLCPAMMK